MAEFGELKTLSDSQITLARKWLSECLGTGKNHTGADHSHCNLTRTSASFLPSRLLDVNIPGRPETICLFETARTRLECFQDLPERATLPAPLRYLTLSHRWQSDNISMTTTETYRANIRGIALNDLDPTFKEAIRLARELGYRYLWIDSLCIIQGDQEDWEYESEQMGKIYMHASLNLANASPPQGSYKHSVGEEDYLVGVGRIEPDSGILQSRGWVLQERICAAGTLFFGSFMLKWACRGAYILENSPTYNRLAVYGTDRAASWFDTSDICQFLSDVSIGGTASSYHLQRHRVFLWLMLMDDYSKRQLTIPSDRLPAISGLASYFQIAFPSWTYAAGLWFSDHDPMLLLTLLWQRDSGETSLLRPNQCHAPSWSWASVPCPVVNVSLTSQGNYIHSRMPRGPCEFLIRNLDLKLYLATPNAFGALDSSKFSSVTMDAKVFPISEFERQSPITTVFESPFLGETTAYAVFDYEDELEQTYSDIYAIALICIPGGDWEYPTSKLAGLLLRQQDSSESGSPHFRRVGVWYHSRNLWTTDYRQETGLVLKDIQLKRIELI